MSTEHSKLYRWLEKYDVLPEDTSTAASLELAGVNFIVKECRFDLGGGRLGYVIAHTLIGFDRTGETLVEVLNEAFTMWDKARKRAEELERY